MNSSPQLVSQGPIGFRPKLMPILVTVLLAFAIPVGASQCTAIVGQLFSWPAPNGPVIAFLYVHHAFQLLLGLLVLLIVRKRVPADYGLHWPRGKSYFVPAIAWGLAFGLLMTVVDYAPQILAHTVPQLDYPLNFGNVTGWLGFEWIYVGPTEEIPFRALLVTYLAARMPGRLRCAGFEMNWAGVIVALIFALLHASNFATRPWPLALGQQIYAFALGVFYAYWLEKSKSVFASAIGHNVGDGVEYTLLFAWIAFGS